MVPKEIKIKPMLLFADDDDGDDGYVEFCVCVFVLMTLIRTSPPIPPHHTYKLSLSLSHTRTFSLSLSAGPR